MNSSISVIFSSNDTLSSKSSKMVTNFERIEVSALSIGKKSIFGLEVERHTARTKWICRVLILYSTDPRRQRHLI
ncbi:hypothetical protein [Genomoviridae sp.]|nr:hypothetical protein [Genomoviridae sp.]